MGVLILVWLELLQKDLEQMEECLVFLLLLVLEVFRQEQLVLDFERAIPRLRDDELRLDMRFGRKSGALAG